jgi:hypothetical protein
MENQMTTNRVRLYEKTWVHLLLVGLIALLPRFAIALQPIPIQLDRMLPDDAYYYFLTAENILAGNGPAVDGIHPSNGWHPLWMLWNLVVFSLPTTDLDLPVHIILLTGATLDSLVAVVLFWNLRRFLGLGAAWIGAGLYAINHMPIFQAVNGLETALAALLLALSWTFSLRMVEQPGHRRAVLWGVLFGLTFLARTDTAVILIWLGLFVLLNLKGMSRWTLTLSGAAAAAVVVIPWLVWNQVNFGSALVQVSSIAVPWAVRTRFEAVYPGAPIWQLAYATIAETSFWFRGDYLGAPMFVGFIMWPLGIFGAWQSWRHDAKTRPLIWVMVALTLGGLCLVVIHTLLRWYPRPWYFVVMAQALAIATGFFWQSLEKRILRVVVIAFAAIITVLVGWFAWQIGYYPWQTEQMYASARWLQDNTPENTIVGSMNSGIIGYYSQRPTINLDGVVNPQAFAASQEHRLMSYAIESDIEYLIDFDNAVLNEYGPFMGPDYMDHLTKVRQIGENYPGLGEYWVYKLNGN